MTGGPPTDISHDDVERHLQDELNWPAYYVSGKNVDAEGFVPAYYRVEGPNGPVSYVNPNGGPHPTTMWSFAMEARANDFEWADREDTPWPEVEDTDD